MSFSLDLAMFLVDKVIDHEVSLAAKNDIVMKLRYQVMPKLNITLQHNKNHQLDVVPKTKQSSSAEIDDK